jgi:peptidoglycan/LPS O-acetylase OafA/YrhL
MAINAKAPRRVVRAPRRPVRLPELDVLRGIAIFAVLFLHSYFRMWPEVTEGERTALRIAHLFAHGTVPVFLFISGFLMARDRSSSFGAFVRRRLQRIAVPAAVWMTLALGYEAWRADGFSAALVRRFVLFDIEGQFYFIFVLAVIMAAGYPLRYTSTRVLARVTAASFLIGLGMIAWYERQPIEGDLAVFAYRNPAIWAFFFVFGLFAYRQRGGTPSWGRDLEVLAGFGMIATLGAYLWQGETRGYPTSYFGVTVFVFSSLSLVVWPALVRLVLRTDIGRLAAWPFAWIGPLTFGIFLVHQPYFLGWMSSNALMGTRFEDSWSQLMVANFVVGAVGSVGFVAAVALLWPRFASLVLGVDRPSLPTEVEGSTERASRAA